LGNQSFFFLLDVVSDDLDQNSGLGVESLVVGAHRRQFTTQQVGDVVFFVRLQDVIFEIGQQFSDCRIHALVLDVGVHRQ
jgi:hypothetical protein